jgi:hypothetical protein
MLKNEYAIFVRKNKISLLSNICIKENFLLWRYSISCTFSSLFFNSVLFFTYSVNFIERKLNNDLL